MTKQQFFHFRALLENTALAESFLPFLSSVSDGLTCFALEVRVFAFAPQLSHLENFVITVYCLLYRVAVKTRFHT